MPGIVRFRKVRSKARGTLGRNRAVTNQIGRTRSIPVASAAGQTRKKGRGDMRRGLNCDPR